MEICSNPSRNDASVIHAEAVWQAAEIGQREGELVPIADANADPLLDEDVPTPRDRVEVRLELTFRRQHAAEVARDGAATGIAKHLPAGKIAGLEIPVDEEILRRGGNGGGEDERERSAGEGSVGMFSQSVGGGGRLQRIGGCRSFCAGHSPSESRSSAARCGS